MPLSETTVRTGHFSVIYSLHSLHLSHSLFDRWGTKDDRATTVLHSSLFSAFRRASPNFNPVHSVMLSSHLFFCLPLLLPPCTVPCRIIFASAVDLVLCPYHLLSITTGKTGTAWHILVLVTEEISHSHLRCQKRVKYDKVITGGHVHLQSKLM